jgi:hypothetical protein
LVVRERIAEGVGARLRRSSAQESKGHDYSAQASAPAVTNPPIR